MPYHSKPYLVSGPMDLINEVTTYSCGLQHIGLFIIVHHQSRNTATDYMLLSGFKKDVVSLCNMYRCLTIINFLVPNDGLCI